MGAQDFKKLPCLVVMVTGVHNVADMYYIPIAMLYTLNASWKQIYEEIISAKIRKDVNPERNLSSSFDCEPLPSGYENVDAMALWDSTDAIEETCSTTRNVILHQHWRALMEPFQINDSNKGNYVEKVVGRVSFSDYEPPPLILILPCFSCYIKNMLKGWLVGFLSLITTPLPPLLLPCFSCHIKKENMYNK